MELEKKDGFSPDKAVNSNKLETHYSFHVILKFWKKESIDTVVSLPESQCDTVENFVAAIKDLLKIKNSHCLEEVWMLQKKMSYEPDLRWVYQCGGRIKMEVSNEYKMFLLKKGISSGEKPYEDPNYGEN